MAYDVKVNTVQADGTRVKHDRTIHSAYKIAEGGVLQLIMLDTHEERWEIHEELSPQEWVSIQGTKYIGSTDSLRGYQGYVVNAEYRD